MCGIAGFFSKQEGVDPTLVQRMVQRLHHRGPDGHGESVSNDRTCVLGHARLAIVDLSDRGQQPFVSADGNRLLTCNGEIYNYPELRRSLEQQGHAFSSNCDSEVILHLYQRYGADCVEHLDGMFAFAIYDSVKGELFCARDPVGKKPLVYAETPDGFGFASEIPALIDLPGIDLTPDPEAIGLYLLRNLRHIPEPWTYYKGIRKLRPGHAMIVRAGQVVRQWRYWSPRFVTKSVAPEELLAQFDEAVEKRRMADVEIGALLSGGVDSSAIVDALSRSGHAGLRTYAFGGSEDDEELERAETMATRLGTRHSSFVFDADKHHDYFKRLLTLQGEPIMALPLTHAYGLFEAIHADGIKVVMTGHGADEVFFGYDGAEAAAALARFGMIAPPRLMRPLAAIMKSLGVARFADAAIVLGADPGHRKSALYIDEAADVWPAFLSADARKSISSTLVNDWVDPFFEGGAPEEFIDEAAFVGLMSENDHAVTIAGDLPAMAHGVEVRCPFLDRNLLETAISIPYTSKVARINGRPQGKLILKEALRGRLPDDVLRAPKRGFGYHVQERDILRGPWKERVSDAFDTFDDVGGLLDPDRVRAAKKAFDQGRDVPAITIAKLYALTQSQQLSRNELGPVAGS